MTLRLRGAKSQIEPAKPATCAGRCPRWPPVALATLSSAPSAPSTATWIVAISFLDGIMTYLACGETPRLPSLQARHTKPCSKHSLGYALNVDQACQTSIRPGTTKRVPATTIPTRFQFEIILCEHDGRLIVTECGSPTGLLHYSGQAQHSRTLAIWCSIVATSSDEQSNAPVNLLPLRVYWNTLATLTITSAKVDASEIPLPGTTAKNLHPALSLWLLFLRGGAGDLLGISRLNMIQQYKQNEKVQPNRQRKSFEVVASWNLHVNVQPVGGKVVRGVNSCR